MIAREANENPKRTRESPKELRGTLGNSEKSGELRKTPGNYGELWGALGNSGKSEELRAILRITTQSTHGFKTEIPFNIM